MNTTDLQGEAETEFCYENANNSCPKLSRSLNSMAVLYVSCGTLMFITVCGNLLVIISVSHFRVLHSPTNFLSLSLALVDCLQGIVVLPFSSIRSFENCWYFGDAFCLIHSGLDTLFCLASIFHLCFISVDRYYAVCDPLLYAVKITIPLTFQCMAIGWGVSVIYSFALILSKNTEIQLEKLVLFTPCIGSCQLAFMTLWGWINFSVFFIPCFLMIGLYIKIYLVARKQATLIENMEDINSSKTGKVSKRERKAAKTLGIAVGLYVFCWVPYMISSIIDAFFEISMPPVIADFMYWGAYINAACNPLIYGFFYPWFRRALKCIITGKIFHSNSSAINLYQG
ncbi:trace amine-associated receptor 5-like [Protopterus annectens]|uniref:trace amine-associated receptor 5-like n=1 Tax=Protopterus annectens TaxID=7888 RepID=UPI001CF9707F|nr:trace amine-associated receptor 5-like [Protopterus annectens]